MGRSGATIFGKKYQNFGVRAFLLVNEYQSKGDILRGCGSILRRGKKRLQTQRYRPRFGRQDSQSRLGFTSMALPPEVAALDFESDFTETPVASLLDWAQTVHSCLSSIPPQPAILGPILERTLAWLSLVQTAVSRLGVFSSNEDEDDMATDSLKYLLVPYYSAEFLAQRPVREVVQRKGSLAGAMVCYDDFLRRCGQYGLLGEVCSETWRRIEEEEVLTDSTTKRNEKVARFKREKAIESEMNRLRALKARKLRLEQDAEEYSHLDGVDEEMERDVWKLTIENATLKAISQRELLSQEIEILEMMESRPAGPPIQRGVEQEEASSSTFTQLKSVAADLFKQHDRQTMKDQVFRPSHILPTYTVEQQAEWETKEAMEREGQQKKAEEEAKRKEAEKDSDDEEDLMKQRAWDDWKDENPRGHGNSQLRPCA
ncbi:hypothetical protein BSKO_05457 [Bryopsis sp. KO-2023]|nr:hypothetical protein BSKO_05457 [Bryopsis sp. KO-2023]